MAANLTKKVNGESVKVSAREAKATIMKANNWSAEEYRKKYDIFKNKLRNYEAYQAAVTGKPVQRQNVVEMLYKQAKSKMRYGADYEESAKMKQIKSFSAVSMTQSRKQAQSAKYRAKVSAAYTNYVVDERFSKFIDENEGAADIVEKFKDANGKVTNPVALEQALSDYANAVHKQERANEANGETYGSDVVIDFNVSSYL